MRRIGLLLLGIALLAAPGWARPIQPPTGFPVDAADGERLAARCASLGREIADLADRLPAAGPGAGRSLLPDVQVLHKAVDWALRFDEFQRSNDVRVAGRLLDLGFARAADLRSGRAPWLTETGRVVRGFVSRIDGSVQPYGVVVPSGWRPDAPPGRVDVWLHGRDDRLTELKFLGERLASDGEFAPAGAVVVHPYGRFCNAFKFAGETDVFEALEHALEAYRGDRSRVGLRGFSMGGAGVWHLAAHHPGAWRAAAPGAGFAETARYTKTPPEAPIPPWERLLWGLYDAPDYAAGFHHLPVLAYSGELDPQRQAADVMAGALAAEGLVLEHLIGPGVQHRYEPGAKRELSQRFDALMSGPSPLPPARVRFATRTLQYVPSGRLGWIRPEGLARHWDPARVDAGVAADGRSIRVALTNVTAFVLENPPGLADGWVTVDIDGTPFRVRHRSDGNGFIVRFRETGGSWRRVRSAPREGKRPGLQGPIDHAFMDSFLVVRPTGRFDDPAVAAWSRSAIDRFALDWRAQFRGELRICDDVDVTSEDIRRHHLILFGDPRGNRMIGRIAGRLPIRWTGDGIRVGERRFGGRGQVAVLIAPNPLNPDRYVVLNSGHTFADWGGTNARQTPWLPDWAVRRVTGDGAAETVAAGFLDEDWRAAGDPGRRW